MTVSRSDPANKAKRTGKHFPVLPAMRLNLTSMIDVIFLLLIYFVITSNFAVGEAVITARMPKAQQVSSLPAPPVIPLRIKMTSQGQYDVRLELQGVSTQPRNFTELTQVLAQLQYRPTHRQGLYEPNNPILIEPDTQVRWQHVVNAFNAAMAAGYTQIRFAPRHQPHTGQHHE